MQAERSSSDVTLSLPDQRDLPAVMFLPSSGEGRDGSSSEEVTGAWLAVLFDLDTFVADATTAAGASSRIELYSIGADTQQAQLISEVGAQPDPSSTAFSAATAFEAAGRPWSISAWPQSGNLPFSDDYSLQFLLGGLAMSVLLFDMALMVDSRRAEAAAVSELMTRKLRESESRIRAVVDHAPDGIVTFDATGAIATFNPGAERVFGYPAAEVRGRSIGVLLPSWWPGNGKQIASFLATLDGDEIGGGEEVEGLRKDKTTVPIELTVSRMASAKRPMFTAIIRDVSERKESAGSACAAAKSATLLPHGHRTTACGTGTFLPKRCTTRRVGSPCWVSRRL